MYLIIKAFLDFVTEFMLRVKFTKQLSVFVLGEIVMLLLILILKLALLK